MKNKWFKLTIQFFLFLSLFSCSNNNITSDETSYTDTIETISLTKAQLELSEVVLGNIAYRCFHDRIKANGKVIIMPNGKITLSYPFAVEISKIYVNDGDKVSYGQILFSIEGAEILKLQQDFANVYFRFQALKNEYNRQKELIKDKVVSEKEFQQLENEYYSQQVQYQTLMALLDKIGINYKQLQDGEILKEVNIYAPATGYIKLSNISKGMVVEPNQPIMELYDLSQLTISMPLFEKDAMNVHQADTVFFYRMNEKDKVYRAVITQISKVVDNETHTVIVYAKPISYESLNLFINSFVQVEIIYHDRLVKALPEEAVLRQNNNYYIYILKEQQGDSLFIFQKRMVNVGATDQNYVEVLDTINEKVIIKGATIL